MRVIVLTHGINTGVEEGRWLNEAKAYLDREIRRRRLGNEAVVLIHRYNPFFAKHLRFIQTIFRRWRRRQVRNFQKYLAWVRKSYGPDSEVYVAAHSFGGYKTTYAATEDTDQPKAFYSKVILFAPAISSRFHPDQAKGHFKEMHIFYSHNDSVIALSPFGQAGYVGPVYADGKVLFGHNSTPFDHNDYFERRHFPKYLKQMARIFLR